MQIYNTKTRQKEEFKPLSSREVKVYFCWPTVYNYAHIWNLRTYVFEDIVIRSLKYLWYNVKTLMNITDIDDKIIRDSQIAKQNLKDFTQKYSDIFLKDLEKLNIEKADNVVPVTTLIPEMKRMIQTMLNRKNAYLWEDNSIYFDISSFKKYWKFANLDMSNLKKSVRIDNDEYEKENASDFVLWKAYKTEDMENFWEEEFIINWEKKSIKWRPGWHIECSACNMKYFGAQIDIHMWWEDLIFPHHQNEIAQTESCTRKEFAKYWLHSGHLMVEWKKMAKSSWNFYTITDLEKKYENISKSVLYRAIRLSFITWKYRESIDFSFEKLESSIKVIVKIDETIKNITYSLESSKDWWISRDFREYMQEIIFEYISYLEDDFNITESIALFHSFIKFTNTWISNKDFSTEELESILDMFETFNQVFAIIDFDILDNLKQEIPENILEKFENRNKAKIWKDFALADSLRDELLTLWYKIVDSRDWTRVEKI